MILRAAEAAILTYCNDDKRESAEKTRLRRVRFIFLNLSTFERKDTLAPFHNSLLLIRRQNRQSAFSEA